MSIDKSLKMKGKLVRPRNVFTRIERLKMLKDEGRWNPTMSVFGIPKVKTVKVKRKGKSEKKAKAETATPAAAEQAATAAAAPAGAKEKAKK